MWSKMETKRIYLKERTDQAIEELLNMPVKEQMAFLGFDDMDWLTMELRKIKKGLVNKDPGRKKWDMFEKTENRVIGNCGFHNWFAEHERAELGYYLSNHAKGNGYMIEALKKVIEYGFNDMKLHRIEAFISTENEPSIKLIKKLGFRKEGVLRAHYKWQNKLNDSVIFSLLQPEFKAD